MTFEEALNKLEGLEVGFQLVRNKYAYGDHKRGWTCSIEAGASRKTVSSFGYGRTSAEACIEAVTKFFEVQSSGIPLASIKAAVTGKKTSHLVEA